MLQEQNEIFAHSQTIAQFRLSIGECIDSCIKHIEISKKLAQYLDQLITRLVLSDQKIRFLTWFKDHFTVSEAFDTFRFECLLQQYSIEEELIGMEIIEIALITYPRFKEHTPYEGYPCIIKKQLFKECLLEDIEFLKIVLNSSLISEYLKKIQSKDIDKIIKNCVHYFQQKIIIRIMSKNQEILAYVLRSKQLVISNFFSFNPRIEVLILIHLYFQQLFNFQGLLYQCSERNRIVDFESEIFPIKFNKEWLTQKRQDYLIDERNWYKDTQTFTQELHIQDTVWVKQPVNAVIQITFHNYLLSNIIQSIQRLLRELAHKDSNELLLKYHLKQHKPKPTFTQYYTNLEYYMCLRDAILRAFNQQTRLTHLKEYHEPNQMKLSKIFNFLINCTDFNKVSLIQQLFLLIFQYEFNATVEHCSNYCLAIMRTDSASVYLSDRDLEMIQTIVQSEGVRKVVLEINRIGGRISETHDLNQEYEYLKNFLKNTPIITFQVDNLHGISLINGRVGLNEKLLSEGPKSRAMRIITLIHEIYCHKKRKDFVCPQCVLELTPEKLNAKQNIIEQQNFPNGQIPGESGFYFEDQIFGRIINNLSLEQAEYILGRKNWQKPPTVFKKKFLILRSEWQEKLNERKKKIDGIIAPQTKQITDHWLLEDLWYRCVPKYSNFRK